MCLLAVLDFQLVLYRAEFLCLRLLNMRKYLDDTYSDKKQQPTANQ